MSKKMNDLTKKRAEIENDLIKKNKERADKEKKLYDIKAKIQEIEEKYAQFRDKDGNLTGAASRRFREEMGSLRLEMVEMTSAVAEATAIQRNVEAAYDDAGKNISSLADGIQSTINMIRQLPGGPEAKAWLDALENGLNSVINRVATNAIEAGKRQEKADLDATKAPDAAEMEKQADDAEATRKSEVRRLKSRLEARAGDVAESLAGGGGVVGASQMIEAQGQIEEFVESFKKFKGKELQAGEGLQFEALVKMLQTAKGEDIESVTVERLQEMLQAMGESGEVSEEIKEILKKSVEETKKQRSDGGASSEQIVIALGSSTEVLDTIQKSITQNTSQQIALIKQEETNKLVKLGVDRATAARIIDEKSKKKGTELQIQIAQLERTRDEALINLQRKNDAKEQGKQDAMIGLLGRMSDDQQASIEGAVEDRFKVPQWASEMIGLYQTTIGVYKEEFDRLCGLFDGTGGFTKFLMYMFFGIGLLLGTVKIYFQKYFGFLGTILGNVFGGKFGAGVANIPNMLKNAFSGIGRMMLGPIKAIFSSGSKFIMLLLEPLRIGLRPFMGILGPIGNALKSVFGPLRILGSVGSGLGPGMSAIGSAVPWFGKIFGFLPKIMGAFQLGKNIASALFPPLILIINIVTAIVGAIRGFAQGGLKGAIIGMIAQILAGFTFGFLSFQDIFDFIDSTVGPLIEEIVGLLMFAYNVLLKPIVDFFAKTFAILKGEGSFFGKIVKIIVEWVITYLKVLAGLLLLQFVKIPILIMKAIFYILKFFYYDIPKMLVQGIMWLWNWFTSGDWLADLANFGTWLSDKLKEFWDWVLNAVADALESFPIIGPRIAKAIRPSKEEDKKVIEDSIGKPLRKAIDASKSSASSVAQSQAAFARNQANYPTYGQGPAAPIAVNAGRVMTENGTPIQPESATTASAVGAARAAAQAAGRLMPPSATVQLNNNQVAGGGGGGSPLIPMGPNRNPDPTYRALLFMEAPAL